MKRKRFQVKAACVNCRKKHYGCDNTRPCKRCTQYGLADTCTDEPPKRHRKYSTFKPERGENSIDIRCCSAQQLVPSLLTDLRTDPSMVISLPTINSEGLYSVHSIESELEDNLVVRNFQEHEPETITLNTDLIYGDQGTPKGSERITLSKMTDNTINVDQHHETIVNRSSNSIGNNGSNGSNNGNNGNNGSNGRIIHDSVSFNKISIAHIVNDYQSRSPTSYRKLNRVSSTRLSATLSSTSPSPSSPNNCLPLQPFFSNIDSNDNDDLDDSNDLMNRQSSFKTVNNQTTRIRVTSPEYNRPTRIKVISGDTLNSSFKRRGCPVSLYSLINH